MFAKFRDSDVVDFCILKSLVVGLAGPYIYKVSDYLPNISVNGLIVSGNRVLAGAAALSAIILFCMMLKYTWVWRALRATAQYRLAAQTLVINTWNIDNYAFAVGVTFAGVAGIMLAPVYMVYPESGVVPAVKGFVILVIGGLGSLIGSLVGGIMLGLAESLGSALIDPKYREVSGFLLMMVILALRPSGLRQNLAGSLVQQHELSRSSRSPIVLSNLSTPLLYNAGAGYDAVNDV